MEIRTLAQGDRAAVLQRLADWELPDGWRGSEWLRRAIEHDPGYSDELVWVAVEGGEPVSCVQLVPRQLRILGHAVPTGGVSTAFARPNHARGAVARALLETAVAEMERRGLELSLLFAAYRSFYAQLGWHSWQGQHTLVKRSEHPPPVRPGETPGADIQTRAFEPSDLAVVQELHLGYSAERHGVVVRDEALWRASFDLAGNPGEEFRLALRDGRVVAYLRAAHLYGVLTAIEMGRAPDGADGLAVLVRELLGSRSTDSLAAPGGDSAAFRAQVLLPTFDDLPLTIAMEHLGLASHPLVDESAMLRCIDLPALARRIGADVFEGESPHDFLIRILPGDRFVFWPADRF